MSKTVMTFYVPPLRPGRPQMDALERQYLLWLIDDAEEGDVVAIGKLFERELLTYFAGYPNSEQTLAEVVEVARSVGMPVAGAHYSDDGLSIVLEPELPTLLEATVKVR